MMKYRDDVDTSELWNSLHKEVCVQQKIITVDFYIISIRLQNECCGAHSFLDWVYVTFAVERKLEIPENFNPLDGPNDAVFKYSFQKQLEANKKLTEPAERKKFDKEFDESLKNSSLPHTCCITPGRECWSGDFSNVRNEVFSTFISDGLAAYSDSNAVSSVETLNSTVGLPLIQRR